MWGFIIQTLESDCPIWIPAPPLVSWLWEIKRGYLSSYCSPVISSQCPFWMISDSFRCINLTLVVNIFNITCAYILDFCDYQMSKLVQFLKVIFQKLYTNLEISRKWCSFEYYHLSENCLWFLCHQVPWAANIVGRMFWIVYTVCLREFLGLKNWW